MKVKEWIGILSSMPDDADVYVYGPIDGDWCLEEPIFHDLNSEIFERYRKLRINLPNNRERPFVEIKF